MVLIFSVVVSFAQGVGIGTSSPNSSALLDLASTNKGFLPPRMTTSQMFAIQNPVPGLLVFNATYNELYQYNGATWRPILNSDYWMRAIANRNAIGNADDSVGIGLNLPTQRLDVNGNARFRNNITVESAVNASTIIATNNIVAGGNATIVGTLQSNNELVINNSAGIVQLRASGEDKAYMQLSGDDIRVGTNIGNTNGNFLVRLNGNVRMNVDPNGTITTTGNIKRTSVSGNHGLLPLAYGVVAREGNVVGASTTDNVSVTRISTGYYEMTIHENLSGYHPTVIITPIAQVTTDPDTGYDIFSGFSTLTNSSVSTYSGNTTVFRIHTNTLNGNSAVPQDTRFSFVIWSPK